MRLEPFHDYLVVRLLPEPAKPAPFVVPVHLQDHPSAHAEVLAIGPEVRDSQVGDHVVVSRLQGYQVEFGEPVLLLRESAVLAHLNGDRPA
jgi:co-chaperonin GroES (HSP10)